MISATQRMAYTRRSNGHAFKSGSQENLSPPPNFFLLPSYFLLFVGLHRQKFAAKPAFHQNKFLIICRSMPKSSNKVTTDQLGRLIYEVRGERVMLDSDLASIYGVETKALNRAVKRNRDRFPKDFMFQLSENEWKNLRYQIGTSSSDPKHQSLRYQIGTASLRHGVAAAVRMPSPSTGRSWLQIF
jgi:hypothetical protein